MFVEKVDVQWVTWDMLKSSDMVKRSVFQHTLEANADVLSRVAAGESWTALCAEMAGNHASLATMSQRLNA